MDLRPTDIKPLEIIQVLLLTEENVEEPTYAKVMKNVIRDRTLMVLFLEEDGCLDRNVTTISYDSVMQHWEGETDIWDISGVEPVKNADDEDDDETLGGFIVEDDEKDNPVYTDERRQFDNSWEEWTPETREGKRYKDIVDKIEEKYC
jgi:hypothetical protein